MLTMVHSNKAYGRAGAKHIWPLANEGNTREIKTSVPNSGAVSPVWTAGEGRYGMGAYNFNGANRILSYSISGTSSLSNFTIAFWYKLVELETGHGRCHQSASGGTLATYFQMDTVNSRLSINSVFAPSINISAEPRVIDVWSYIMFQRNGSNVKAYFDGAEMGSDTSSTVFPNWGARKFHIGNQGDWGNENVAYTRGYIQDFIITPYMLPTTPPVRPLR